jgi:diaminohydroxyphosphoribosylaminopyrimidine deaminase/5-amino-6-(5-phosphoribosylamino)uracil reductase
VKTTRRPPSTRPYPRPVDAPLDERERALLDRAIVLGRQGWGRVHPNPLVGCVIARDGEVLGEGWHEEYGGPHAEVQALNDAGEAARGATAYVSLEPCRHQGKTPPCTDALVRAGVSRVVYGAADPGTESGGGAEALRAAGLEVIGPTMNERQAIHENPAFMHNARTGSTFVALKLAMSLDARIAARVGERTELTGAAAHRWVHSLRAGHDGIMVGAGTALVDDPRLTVREAVAVSRKPARIVVDSAATIPPGSRLFADIDEVPVFVFVRNEAPRAAVERLEEAGAQVTRVPAGEGGVDLASVFRACWNNDIRSVLCEGGGVMASSLLSLGLVHRLYLLFAPRTLGSGAVPAFADLPDSAWSRWVTTGPSQPLDEDALVIYDRLPHGRL